MTNRRDEQSAVERGLRSIVQVEGRDAAQYTLAEQMERYRVPGASIAVVDDGEIAWAAGYGHKQAPDSTDRTRSTPSGAVTPTTLFQAASISKLVTSIAALALVDRGIIDPDSDVNRWLRRWRVPDNDHTRSQPVTLRRLLTHTAGTTVPWFAGYLPDEPLPSPRQILRGEPPTAGPAVTVDAVPGSVFRYSGGGTTIVQLLLEDVSGVSFPHLIDELVFTPAGMTDSCFDQPLLADRRPDVASGHDPFGAEIYGGWRIHPELAAAGMWSTAADLARLIVAIGDTVGALRSPGVILSAPTARQAVTPHEPGGRGLIGSLLAVDQSTWQYAHDGANAGYRARVEGFTDRPSGLVVMTNGDGGAALIGEVRAAVAETYGWPDLVTRHAGATVVPAEILDRYAGRYVDQDGGEVTIVHEEGTLYSPSPYGRRELVPIDHRWFLDDETGVEVVFAGADGQNGGSDEAIHITVVHEGQPIMSYVRVPTT